MNFMPSSTAAITTRATAGLASTNFLPAPSATPVISSPKMSFDVVTTWTLSLRLRIAVNGAVAT